MKAEALDGSRRALVAVTVIWLAALIASGIAPRDRLTWWMEVGPVLIVLPLLLATGRAFPFTTLAYVLICIHGLILVLGGAYMSAHVQAGVLVEEVLWARVLSDCCLSGF